MIKVVMQLYLNYVHIYLFTHSYIFLCKIRIKIITFSNRQAGMGIVLVVFRPLTLCVTLQIDINCLK